MPERKRCYRCGKTKPLTEFHRHPQSRDGLQPRCKACRAEYYQAHKARYLVLQRARRARWTPGQRAARHAYFRAYYARNRDVLREKARLRREAERAARLPWYSTAPVL